MPKKKPHPIWRVPLKSLPSPLISPLRAPMF
jgi:hypothetical protein